jgi:hypothetical protein
MVNSLPCKNPTLGGDHKPLCRRFQDPNLKESP